MSLFRYVTASRMINRRVKIPTVDPQGKNVCTLSFNIGCEHTWNSAHRFVLHRGNTRGHVVSINSRNTYVSDAAGNYIHEGHAIIFVPDANGLNYASAIL